jgi:UDP-N-acetylglucosamine 2-epimerase (non-hydrolysing)
MTRRLPILPPMPTRAPIAVLFGTRPEAIKLAPVILALRERHLPHVVVTTGQHRGMVDEVLALFGIEPDVDLGLMRQPQSLDYLLTRAVDGVGDQLDRLRPSAAIVQGDTTSMLGSVLAAFHRGIPVAHVEAGLRSGDMALPFPEEMNRRAASLMARWHFAPTEGAAENLRAERVTGDIHVVGNTVVDAMHAIHDGSVASLPASLAGFLGEAPYILATAHRRESWGTPIAGIATGLHEVIEALPDLRLVFVAHPNPAARGPVDEILGHEERACVVDALPYPVFLHLIRGARAVVSDSGGVQEEGPTLGVPVLVTRSVTERHEGVAAGAVRLIGTDAGSVRDATLALLGAPDELAAMGRAGHGLYGDGHAAERIARVLASG